MGSDPIVLTIFIEETRKLSGKLQLFKLIDDEGLMVTLPAAS